MEHVYDVERNEVIVKLDGDNQFKSGLMSFLESVCLMRKNLMKHESNILITALASVALKYAEHIRAERGDLGA